MRRVARNVRVALVSLGLLLCVSPWNVDAQVSSAADTGDDSYMGSYTAAQLQSGGTGDDNPYLVVARNDWLREVYGTNPPSDFGRRLFQELQTQQARYPQQVSGAQAPFGIPVWQSIGPTRDIRVVTPLLEVVDSGRLQVILPHPSDPNTVYVLSAGGGVWKTTNFASPVPTWVPKTDRIFTTSGGSMAFGRDPNTLYLGLGDPFGGVPLAGGAMLRSTDGGDTWTTAPFINLPGAAVVTDVKVDTSQAQDIVLVGTDNGLWRSTDGGRTYTQVGPFKGVGPYPIALGGVGVNLVWSLAQTSAGWLASYEVNWVGGFFGASSSSVLYLSTDHGATWTPITNAGNGYSNAGRTTLAVGAPGDSVVYAFAAVGGAAGDTDQGDLFRSTDGGQTWTPLHLNSKVATVVVNSRVTAFIGMDLMGFQAWFNQMILVDPSDPSRSTVYLGGQLFTAKTLDGGQTWTLLTNPFPQAGCIPVPRFGCAAFLGLPYAHADFHCAAFSALGSSPTIFFGSDGGLFISQDGGATWSSEKNQGLVDTMHYSLATDPQHPADVITGLQDLGTRVRQGSTGTFNQTFGGDGLGTAWAQATGTISMGSLFFDLIFNSTFDPQNIPAKWQFAFNGIDISDASFFTPLTSPSPPADPTGQLFYTSTFHHIYQTTNGGGSWAPIFTTGQSGTAADLIIRPVINSLGIAPQDTKHVAAAANGGRVLITTDGGTTWTQPNLNALVSGWLSFNSTVAWANSSVLYVGNNSPFARQVRVAKSTDGGTTWQAATSGLPNVPVNQLLASPADPTGNTVYAATFLGVYQTTDGGQNWHLFGAGLPAVVVYGLYTPPDGSFLRIATFGRGIWEITP